MKQKDSSKKVSSKRVQRGGSGNETGDFVDVNNNCFKDEDIISFNEQYNKLTGEKIDNLEFINKNKLTIKKCKDPIEINYSNNYWTLADQFNPTQKYKYVCYRSDALGQMVYKTDFICNQHFIDVYNLVKESNLCDIQIKNLVPLSDIDSKVPSIYNGKVTLDNVCSFMSHDCIKSDFKLKIINPEHFKKQAEKKVEAITNLAFVNVL